MLDDFLLFVEVARRGSYSKAARDLTTTAPTLSKRILLLEERLGESLFIRSSRGVKLTSFGKGLFEQLGETTLNLHQAVTESSKSEAVSFVLHCPQNLIIGQLYPALEAFLLEKSHVDVAIEPANTNVLLSQTSFDLAIRSGEQRDSSFYQKKLASIAVCLVSRRDCKSRERLIMPYSKTQISGQDLLSIERQYSKVSRVNDITLVRKLVASGMGVGLLPMTEIADLYSEMSGHVQYDSEILFTRPMYALWANKPKPSSLSQDLITCIESCVQNTPALQGRMVDLT
ncbi:MULTISPECIES: LysR family transcriptional regulator [Vibrio]|jgi:LysR family transcriptional regulator, transcriptional activator AphB|uniref:LysR family transcriptional regulator n=3 Tax=Vibrio TaxID=662 RepID=A0A4U1YX65_9VIBR|nr:MULTISPECIES: LysR family transcriptional regulator [Vibrio]CAH6844822.1 LysR family transcriptional regulator [Vibrio chagasii]MCQ8866982.1 LysR family transcriptional regulator [Vibrio splendidus]MCW4443290.1 LysR family transcriptional regulator [Vibrio splendidus]TKF24507.1 LysR family transcriptional regulator [Vibrio kanaloae]CAH6973054.1 LysR family transcriptional regulator [Vibrio chagasii]